MPKNVCLTAWSDFVKSILYSLSMYYSAYIRFQFRLYDFLYSGHWAWTCAIYRITREELQMPTTKLFRPLMRHSLRHQQISRIALYAHPIPAVLLLVIYYWVYHFSCLPLTQLLAYDFLCHYLKRNWLLFYNHLRHFMERSCQFKTENWTFQVGSWNHLRFFCDNKEFNVIGKYGCVRCLSRCRRSNSWVLSSLNYIIAWVLRSLGLDRTHLQT